LPLERDPPEQKILRADPYFGLYGQPFGGMTYGHGIEYLGPEHSAHMETNRPVDALPGKHGEVRYALHDGLDAGIGLEKGDGGEFGGLPLLVQRVLHVGLLANGDELGAEVHPAPCSGDIHAQPIGRDDFPRSGRHLDPHINGGSAALLRELEVETGQRIE